MTEKEYNVEKENVIEFIKTYRLSDEKLLHNLSPNSISYPTTEKSLKYWDMVLTSLQSDPIEVEAAKLQKAYEEGYNKGKNEFFNFDAPLVKAGDAISRQAVLEQTYNWSKDEFLRVTNPFYYLRKRINALPPVTPQPKMGHWINAYPDIEPNPMFMYGICSVCGFEQSISNKLNYCPNCGTKMEDK